MRPLLFLAVLLCSFSAFSQVSSIVGTWRTIDDKTNEPKSIVRIYKGTDGKYVGKIEKLFQNQDGKCVECKGANHNKPILGLVIINDMREDGDKLVGGTILDPANGKEYFVTISLEKDGRLRLRGSLDRRGVIGRNQFWVREK